MFTAIFFNRALRVIRAVIKPVDACAADLHNQFIHTGVGGFNLSLGEFTARHTALIADDDDAIAQSAQAGDGGGNALNEFDL